ncbi:bifunctional glutamate N-acetyltransferase/amino-acid acetyltransferase ArgJ [Bradyrhizobium sp. Arg237L]|uniref:bifunctional glutamate N-acetyltransferase/amino-acid acetyltransferase ArgJ n=1 Tax=Bradyrhizobium sp. Arg237L TaxID=3003352 RepID=UPI00249E322B|nr:bifunctional glutamate N-acetyltransferase/amino-acid acetyltransferase ArgJ [Bradyrhizobium sp. Arg237L]MDI4237078.1 bifunctional glutamate N-acetyltransferase/amino-acid acetyltransferase ArgJ [Bradyrhizobium sp. Arg237L]
MSTAVSPLAPTDVPDLPAIAGVRLATAAAGIRYKGRTDVLLAVMEKGTTVAGVFTKSKCPSAPVEWCRAKLGKGGPTKGGFARALVVNSGNANAFTGKTGKQSTALTAQIAAKAVGCGVNEVFLASTGVIGEPLDATKFDGVLATLAKQAGPDDWMSAAKAIMTTDTFPKVATATVKLGKAKVTINGMAKGAGMIAPDMATMLSFIFTDAPLSSAALQQLLKSGVEDTFNAVTIDGDTSTSDTLLAFATGTAAADGAPKISRASDPRLKAFTKAFRDVLADLAEQVARDGEGARKLVEIIVDGATTKASARKIAMSVANSPLVKTAIAGEDANWGRVVMAVGKAGEPANRDKLSISFNGIRVAKSGARDPSYNEPEVSQAMKQPKIQIKVNLGLGKGRDRVLTCDLTKEYVAINGDYRS